MQKQKSATTSLGKLNTLNEFESASRNVRWFIIIVIILSFPTSTPQTYYIYGFALLATLYNLSRYSPTLLRSKIYASPITLILIDNLFICLLIALVGDLSTPYSAFIFLMAASAAYWYRMTGVIAVVIMQIALIYTAIQLQPFNPINLDFTRAIIITTSSLLALGWLVERLTRNDKKERDMFRAIAKENESESSHLKALVDSLKSAIFVVDASGRIILNNGTAAAITGKTGDMKGLAIIEVLPLRLRTKPESKPVNIIKAENNPQHRRDLFLPTGDNKSLDLDINIRPVKLQDSNTTNYVIICEDITHELSINEQRSEFISVASHELRTPIAIMEAALSTVLHAKERLPKDTVEIIEQAHSNSMLLSGIVSDLATLAEAKNDNIPIQLENIDAGKLASQIADDFKQQASQKGLTLELDKQPELPTVLSTERHIREILQNYLTNAIKYSDEGTITVAVSPTNKGGIEFSVKDTGIGISPRAQKSLFNKFFRAEDYRTQHVGGTGLGLYLCKELAERLGGKVWCESVLNEGSTFFLEVPPFSGLKRDSSEVTQANVANLIDDL